MHVIYAVITKVKYFLYLLKSLLFFIWVQISMLYVLWIAVPDMHSD